PRQGLWVFGLRFVPLNEDGTIAGPHYVTPRFFPNHPALRFAGRVHEQIVSVDPEQPAQHGILPDVALWHFGYSNAVVADRGKLARNLALIEQAVAEDADDPFHYYNLG